MRKRISVCMLAVMMSVTSMYSFVAQGAENETEQETGIEQESETQAEEAVKVFQRGSGFQMRMHYRRYMMLYGMGYRFRHWKQIQLRIHYKLKFNIFQ